jgi:membrane fusion protein, multidrug efflux system
MFKRALIVFTIFFAVVGVIGFYKYNQIQAAIAQNANFAPPPETVTSVNAALASWPQSLDTTASFSAYQGVTLSAEEPGKISRIQFESGQKVEAGSVLVQLDTSVEEAQLKSAAAKAELAMANAARVRKLRGTGALADREIDDAEAQVDQTAADMQALMATIDRKTIKAPFSGILGIRQVDLGQYLQAGNAIVVLQTLNPIYVDFSLPQQALSVLRVGQEVGATVEGFSEPFPGKINAINPLVDTATRTVKIQATLDNAREALRPGMYGRVQVVVGPPQTYITIPSTCINHAPYGDSVYIIETIKNPQGMEYLGVRQQFVKVGPARGDQVAILEGLKEGQQIASSGLFKLREGTAVVVNNEITPSNNPQPAPKDS